MKMLHYPVTHMTTPMSLSFPNVQRRLPQQPPPRRPSKRCCSLSFDQKTGGGKGMSRFHEMELQVRDCELGQYGIVKQSDYCRYIDHGTVKLLEKIGFDEAPVLAVSEFVGEIIAPLRKNDKFLLKVRMSDYSLVRLYFEDLIFKLPNQELVAKSKSTVVVLDKNNRPCRMSQSLMSNINQFLQMENRKA